MKKNKANIFIAFIGFITIGLAGCASHSPERNKWLASENVITITKKKFMGINDLERIYRLINKHTTEKEFNKITGKYNKEYKDCTETQKFFFFHPSVTIDQLPKGLQKAIRSGQRYHMYLLYASGHKKYGVGSFWLNKGRFKRQSVEEYRDGYAFFVFSEKGRFLAKERNYKNKRYLRERKNPLGPLGNLNFGDAIKSPQIKY